MKRFTQLAVVLVLVLLFLPGQGYADNWRKPHSVHKGYSCVKRPHHKLDRRCYIHKKRHHRHHHHVHH